MISTNFQAISFKADSNKQPSQNPNGSKKPIASTEIIDKYVQDATQPRQKEKKGLMVGDIIGNTIDSFQKFLKFKARASEYTKGAAKGVVAGIGIGGAVMSLDWAMNGVSRVAHKKAKASIFLTEPATFIGHAFGKTFKGIWHIPNMKVKDIFKNVLHSPIDLFNYIKNAKNVTKAGKIVAPFVGMTALAYCLTKAVMNANRRVADLEHAFNSGHAHDLK